MPDDPKNAQLQHMITHSKSSESPWKKLTRLFRSGPVVRHKIAAGEHNAEPQGSARAYKKEISSLYIHSLASYGQYERLSRYADYSEMVFTPEIASALCVFADETTAKDEHGELLQVITKNQEIKQVLQTLFYDILNVEFNLWSWVRNLCQFGDFVLFVDASEKNGVLNLLPIPINEIEREEGYDKKDPFAVRFRWLTQGNMILENWQVIHFRLLGNDNFLPYGSSIIEPARRIWRQLILIEDAMMVYRIVRSPERRVFKIDVGNIAPDQVEQFIEKVKTQLKRTQVTDPTTGRVDLRYNPLCFQGSTLIPLLDGRTISIKQLSEEWSAGRRDQETYTLDLKKGGRLVPGRIVWCGTSGHAKEMIQITLDDGGVIRVTPDHHMMLRDGNPCFAKDLQPGDSLMPLHSRYTQMNGDISSDPKIDNSYEQILDIPTGDYFFTHRLVCAHNEDLPVYRHGYIGQQGRTVHHKNFMKRNNSSSNLELMKNGDHSALHARLGRENIIRYNKSDQKRLLTAQLNHLYQKAQNMGAQYNGSLLHEEHNIIRSCAMKRMWDDPARRQKTQENMSYRWSPECQNRVIEIMRGLDHFEGLGKFLLRLSQDQKLLSLYARVNSHLKRDVQKSFHKNAVGKFITAEYSDFKSFFAAHHPRALDRSFVNNVDVIVQAQAGPNNHRVVSIERLSVDEDVYNITVDGHHNLAVQAPNCEGTNKGKVQSFQSVDEDYFIPIRGDRGSDISTLAGGQFTGDIDDVQYIQNKLFGALQIPKAYLSYTDDVGSKATLSQLDVRFSRTIDRIQKIVIAELNKIAIIHLFLLGYRGDDLVDFELRLANSSLVAEQQFLELWRTRLEIAGSAQEGVFDREFIWKNIFKLSDDQIDAIREGKRFDKLEDLALEQVQLPGDEGAAAGQVQPGEGELPSTLGGPGGGGMPPMGGGGPPPEGAPPEGEEEAPSGAPPGFGGPQGMAAGVARGGTVLSESEGRRQTRDWLVESAQTLISQLDGRTLIAAGGPNDGRAFVVSDVQFHEKEGVVLAGSWQDDREFKVAFLPLKDARLPAHWRSSRFPLRSANEVRNPGSEDPMGAKTQRDVLSPTESGLAHATATPKHHTRNGQKPSARDPERVRSRLIHRPFSEDVEEQATRELEETEDLIRSVVDESKKIPE